MSFLSIQSWRPRAGAVVLAVVACLAADVVGARGAPPRRLAAPRMAFERAQRPAVAQQRAAQRQAQERPPEAAPAPVEPQAPATRPGRLTPDERRALRQQINDAGREIYRPARP